MQTLGPMPCVDVNAIFDPAFPKGALNYWKSSFLRDFSDDAIAVLVDRFARTRSPMSQIVLEYMHGAAVSAAGRDGLSASGAGLQPARPLTVDRPGLYRGGHRLGARDLRVDGAVPSGGWSTSIINPRRVQTPWLLRTATTTPDCKR